MLAIPDEIKELLHKDTCFKNIRIHFQNGERSDICNDQIVMDSVSFTESLCSQDTLKFGLCEASVFECEVVGVSNVTGAVIEVTCEVFCPFTVEGAEWKADLEKWVYSIPYGTFVINEAKRQADIIHRKIVAYSLLSGYDFRIRPTRIQYFSAERNPDKFYGTEALALILQTDAFLLDGVYTEQSLYESYTDDYWCWLSSDEDAWIQYYSIALDDDLNADGYITPTYLTDDQGNPLDLYNNRIRVFAKNYEEITYPDFTANMNQMLKFTGFKPISFEKEADQMNSAVIDYFSQFEYVTAYSTNTSWSPHRTAGSEIKPQVGLNYTQHNSKEHMLWFDNAFTDIKWNKISTNPEELYLLRYSTPKYLKTCNFALIRDYAINTRGNLRVYNNAKTDYINVYFSAYLGDTDAFFWKIRNEIIRTIKNSDYWLIEDYSNAIAECEGYIDFIFSSYNTADIENVTVEKITSYTNYFGPYSYKQFLIKDFREEAQALIEFIGKFAQFSRSSNMIKFLDIREQFGLVPGSDLYPGGTLYPEGVTGGKLLPEDYQSCWYNDNYTLPFGAVYCRYKNSSNEDAELLIYLPGFNAATPPDTYNIYDISSNKLITESRFTEAALTAKLAIVCAALEGITYMPVEFVGRGLPYVEAGDTFEILTGSNDSITTIVLRRTISGEMVLTDSYKSV